MKYTIRDSIHWKFIKRNAKDFIEGFLPITPVETTTKGKKILIFNWRDTKHRFAGGAEVYIHELAKRFVKDGHHVTVFCGNDSSSLRNEVVDGVSIVRRGGFYFVYVWAFLYYMLHFRGRFDVVIDSQNGIPFFTPLYVKEPIFSLLFHVHQEVFRKSLIKPLSDLASFLEQKCMPYFYKNIPFLTISESTKKEIQHLGLGKKGITIIYPGVDLDHLFPGKKSTTPFILYLGRLKYYKRVDTLLRSAREVLMQIPSAKFVIAGDGEHKKNLKKIAKRLEIDNKIEFLGKVSEKRKAALYKKAWVVVNPSMMEGWGITTIEANACGTPVIASNVPGLRDSVKHGHSGYLFEHDNDGELTAKIMQVITNSKLRRKLSMGAYSWARKFDWNISAIKGLEAISGMYSKRTLTIAIPAYNEGKSIKQLVNSYLQQKGEHFTLDRILVLSDGSTDNTVSQVRSIKDKRVRVIDDGKRLGKSARMNQLKTLCNTDLLLFSDADITVDDDFIIEKMLIDTDIERAGVLAPAAIPHPARTLFEKSINHSVFMQNFMRRNWNNGENYLSFRGCFLILHKSLYKNALVPEHVVNNDAYLYFKAKELGFTPSYIPSTRIFYRSPATFLDHLKQTSRYQHATTELSEYFPNSISTAYKIPRLLTLESILLYGILNPFLLAGYIGIFMRSKFVKHIPIQKAWNIAVSTKSVN